MIEAKKRKRGKARRLTFTETNVLTLQPRRQQYMIWDGGSGRGSKHVARGLHILVSPMGAKSFRSTYYFPGSSKPHFRNLGRVGVMTLAEARDECRKDQRHATEGTDPKSDNPSATGTYEAIVKEYVDRVQINEKQNVSAEECRRVLLRGVPPEWLTRPIATIRPQEVQRVLELVRDGDVEQNLKPRGPSANVLHARLQPFFAWCAKPTIGKLKVSPMVGIDRPWRGEQRPPREWFKGKRADEVIAALWLGADKLSPTEGAYLKLLILTGKRKTALANMRWEHIDDTWFWDAPQPGKKRNKRLHPIPLPSYAQRILHPRQDRGFVFPEDDGRIEVKGEFQSRIIKASGVKDFFYHGVRHVAETKMAELKILPHIRDMVFDHVPNRGSGQGYDHHVYRDEMLAALETWADHVARLVTPEGVARLR